MASIKKHSAKTILTLILAVVFLGIPIISVQTIETYYSIDNPPPAEYPLFEEIKALNEQLDELSLLIKGWGA